MKRTNEEMLYIELIHFTRGARRYLHGEGPHTEGPAFPDGPDCPPGRRPHRPHSHRSPVLARERILTLLLEHEVPQDQERENVLPSDGKESPAETGTFSAGLRQKQLTELMYQEGDSERGIQVYIGDESPLEATKDCSVVTATYHIEEGVYGKIGIIGPRRMDYEKVVGTLKNLMSELDQIFKKDK